MAGSPPGLGDRAASFIKTSGLPALGSRPGSCEQRLCQVSGHLSRTWIFCTRMKPTAGAATAESTGNPQWAVAFPSLEPPASSGGGGQHRAGGLPEAFINAVPSSWKAVPGLSSEPTRPFFKAQLRHHFQVETRPLRASLLPHTPGGPPCCPSALEFQINHISVSCWDQRSPGTHPGWVGFSFHVFSKLYVLIFICLFFI